MLDNREQLDVLVDFSKQNNLRKKWSVFIKTTERETMETEVIKLLISSYFNIVKRTVADIVPKTLMLKLTVKSRTDIQKVLLGKLYGNQDIEKIKSMIPLTPQVLETLKKQQ